MQVNLPLIERVSAMLRDMLGDDFDAETFCDTLDGETDAMSILGRLIRDRAEAIAHADASKALSQEYAARAARLTAKAAAASATMGLVLDAMGERKVAHPLGTVSRTTGRASVQITDEASIPTQLCKTTVTPDRAAIKAQLDAGETVPGAVLVVGADGVSVRIK